MHVWRIETAWICIISAVTSWTACAEKRTADPEVDRPKRLVYKTIGDVELHLHVFEPADRAGADALPAIVFFFGGGWANGTPSQFYPQCNYFASRNMAAFSAEYRIKNKHGTTPYECVKDGKSAVRWLRVHAGELGIDPERIVAGGGSAGGHVAAATAMLPDIEEAGEDLSVSSVPNALVLFNPAIDTTGAGYGDDKVGARPEELSPAHHVAKHLPPTILFHGTDDATVPFENAKRFRDLMKAAGNRCELVPFEGKGHGFFNEHRDAAAFRETIRAADGFLVSLGFLDPKDAADSAKE